jgi:hypothetical protein
MRRPGLVRAALALAVWSAGCEVMIDGKLHDVRCQDEGAVGPPACSVGFECKSGVCVATELGSACEGDADCGRGAFCLDPALFGETGGARCSRPCCTSGDCDPDARFVCWIAPNGAGGFCRASSDVGRAEGGSGKPAAPCEDDGDCRSGRCDAGRCADTCCSDTPCSVAGGACRFGVGPDGDEAFWCAAPPQDAKPRYAPCDTDAECASGLCIPLAPDGGKRCSVPCCDSTACGTLPDEGIAVACAEITAGSGSVRACSVLVPGPAAGAVGSPCADGGDCRSGMCADLDGDKRCTDACCADASCGDPSSFVCRPARKGDAWALRCEPK